MEESNAQMNIDTNEEFSAIKVQGDDCVTHLFAQAHNC
jgi:hypothetical protein